MATNEQFVIAPFTLAAYDAVFALWQACEGVGLNEADSRENIAAYLERNAGMSFVALVEGSMVGAVLCGHDGRCGLIHHLAVRPDYRRRGLGRELAGRCLDALRDTGICRCHLFVFSHNAGAIAFWQSLGWIERTDIGVFSKDIGP